MELLAPAILAAKEYSFKLYGQPEGLKNQVINCLVQDRQGFLWAGTQNGLYRYDGARFSFFGRADGLPDETIQSLYESPAGTLWVGTRSGLATFDGKGTFVADPVLGRTQLFGYSNMVSDAAGRLYIGTARGLAVRDPKLGLDAKSPSPSFHVLTRDAVHGVYADPEGRVWFGAGGRLWQWKDGVAVESGEAAKLPDDRWDAMLEDRSGTFWVRSAERLLFRAKGSAVFQAVPGIARSPEFGSIYQTGDGRVFVPTGAGLVSDPAGNGREQTGKREGLVSDETTCLLQDREGSVWVGLGGEGLERWLGFNEWESWTTADGLGSSIVWDAHRDSSGRLWTATEAGLYVQNSAGGNWNLRSAPGLSVRVVLPDPANQDIWYGANPGGVYRLDGASRRVTRFGARSGLSGDRIDRLVWGPGHELWVTTREGLFRGRFSGSEVRFDRPDLPYSDANEAFFGGVLDHRGRLWFAGSRGIVVLEQGHWRRFSRGDGLAGDGVSQLAEAPDGAIWIGYLSNAGLSRLVYDRDRVHFDHFTTNNGLTSNGTVFVSVDRHGWVWAGSDNGVDVRAHDSWWHYGKANGLASDDCDAQAFFEDADGSVWIGTSGGLSHFRVSSHSFRRAAPPIYITGVSASGRALDPYRPQPVSYAGHSMLFQFAAPAFENESALRFRYRLLGLDTAWGNADERWVRYPDLEPGAYTFQVIAQTAAGEWSPEPATVSFQIRAPWWQTWRFRALCAVAIGLLAHLMWRFRIRYLVQKQQLLEALLQQARTASQLKSEALEKITKGEVRERNRSHVLELVGSHQPLPRVLDAIIRMVELDDPNTLCLILGIQDGHFCRAAARNLPADFANLFDGMSVDASETCFAAAATSGMTISVPDLAASPLWTKYAGRFEAIGVYCSRSAPILSSAFEVLGTISYFRRQPFVDQRESLGSLESAERLASVAIEHLSLYEQLSYRAQYDVLTGLPNRVLFHDRLQKAITHGERNGTKVWVLWLDLDGFKHVNDTLGHQAGDAMLKEIASRVQTCVRREDTAARMGGDEFAVIIEGPAAFQIDAVIRRLILALSAPVSFGNRESSVTASVGVSIYPDNAQSATELVRYADVAMYEVKRQGKNAHTFFLPEMGNLEAVRIEIETHLRHALANREFEVHYQPQFRLDRSLAGFEALLRWTNPQLGAVSPARFVPLAEATGLIVPIGQWVLEEACRQTAEWIACGFTDFRMAVNVSAFQIARLDFPDTVARLLEETRIEPQQLELELTETSLMNDVGKSSAQLRMLRDMGVTVSIDDFGTGYSSLSYLQRLPVDTIKIDQSFVRDIGVRPSSSGTMIQAIIALAHDLNLRVVAEGVETEEQFVLLRDLGCDLAQGFLLSKPLTRQHAARLLQEHSPRVAPQAEAELTPDLVGR